MVVVPAQAGTQCGGSDTHKKISLSNWIPACPGTTEIGCSLRGALRLAIPALAGIE
jgi:hypothetical protein